MYVCMRCKRYYTDINRNFLKVKLKKVKVIFLHMHTYIHIYICIWLCAYLLSVLYIIHTYIDCSLLY